MRDSSSTNFVWRGSDGAMGPSPACWTDAGRACPGEREPSARDDPCATGGATCDSRRGDSTVAGWCCPWRRSWPACCPRVATVVVVHRFVGLCPCLSCLWKQALPSDEAKPGRRRGRRTCRRSPAWASSASGSGSASGGGGLPGPSFDPGAATAGFGSGPPARTGPPDGATDGWAEGSVVGGGDGATEGDGSADGVTGGTTGDGWPAGSARGAGAGRRAARGRARPASRPGRRTTPAPGVTIVGGAVGSTTAIWGCCVPVIPTPSATVARTRLTTPRARTRRRRCAPVTSVRTPAPYWPTRPAPATDGSTGPADALQPL